MVPAELPMCLLKRQGGAHKIATAFVFSTRKVVPTKLPAAVFLEAPTYTTTNTSAAAVKGKASFRHVSEALGDPMRGRRNIWLECLFGAR